MAGDAPPTVRDGRVPPERGWRLVAVLVPAAVVVSVASVLTDATHLRNYLVQYAALGVALHLTDRAVRLGEGLWWTCVGLVVANLTMGAVFVGGDEIYNVEVGTHLMRLDHPMHLAAAWVMTLVCARALDRVVEPEQRGRLLVIAVAALAALGLGAIKELSDSITGLDTDPAEVVWSTRWDLVFNTVGAACAALQLWWTARRRYRRAAMTSSPKPARVSGAAKSVNQP